MDVSVQCEGEKAVAVTALSRDPQTENSFWRDKFRQQSRSPARASGDGILRLNRVTRHTFFTRCTRRRARAQRREMITPSQQLGALLTLINSPVNRTKLLGTVRSEKPIERNDLHSPNAVPNRRKIAEELSSQRMKEQPCTRIFRSPRAGSEVGGVIASSASVFG